MKIIYVCGGDVSVFESQVLELLKFLHQHDISVVLLQGYSSEKEKQNISRKIANYEYIDIVWAKSCPVYPIFTNQAIKSYYNGLKTIPEWQDAILHIRSEYDGYIFCQMVERYKLSNKILIDFRALGYEELSYKIKHHSSVKRRILNLIQHSFYGSFYRKLFNCDNENLAITSVSPEINRYIRQNYPYCKLHLSVRPNIAGNLMKYSSERRIEIRTELGLTDNDVVAVCSTGGGAMWQRDRDVVRTLLDCGLKIINLSKSPIEMSNCINMFVPFSKVPDYLSAADAAVLWRENTFMNQSASPSKLSEFATMGLYIIHNGTVKIAEEYIRQSGAGVIFENTGDIGPNLIEKIKAQDRDANCISGINMFGVDAIGNSYITEYKRLSKL